VDHMAGSAHPNAAVGFEHPLAGDQPGAIKLVVEVRAARLVPFAFVYAHHAPGVTSDPIVGKKIGRVGENQVNAFFRDGGENLQAVALEDLQVMFSVLKNRRRQLRQSLPENVGGSLHAGGALARHSIVPSSLGYWGSLIETQRLSR